MADTTTRYGFPYQEAGDPPDGASLGQDLAEAVENSLGTLEDNAESRLDALEARATVLETRPHTVVTLGESVPNAAITLLTPTAEQLDIGGMWTSGAPTVITIPTGQGGWYEVGIVARWASQATVAGQRNVRIYKNGAEEMSFTQATAANVNATNIPVSGVYELSLADGDTISFYGFQASGAALSIIGNSRAWVRRLR
jgi:hypothetical protein